MDSMNICPKVFYSFFLIFGKKEYWSNQKLVLCEALLNVTAWREFAALSARLPTTSMAARPAVALCTMLHALVEPLYRT